MSFMRIVASLNECYSAAMHSLLSRAHFTPYCGMIQSRSRTFFLSANLVLIVAFGGLGGSVLFPQDSVRLLHIAVSVVFEIMVAGNEPANWWLFLAVPVVFGALTAVGHFVNSPRAAYGTSRIAARSLARRSTSTASPWF
jgi:hypothetical protein